MKYPFIKTILALLLFVVLAQAIDRYFFDLKINNFGTVMMQEPTSFIFSKLESAGFFFRGLVGFKNIIFKNENLIKENLGLLSRLADYEDLESENEFLRKALEMPARFKREVVYAHIYQFQLGLDGYDVLLNKGAGDGIAEGDTIITAEGVLVGRIEKTYDNFSRALVVSDTDFSVTAKILNSDTVGIARGALEQGLYFDLIVQSDLIKEGDVVVSSGVDLFPPALIVGTVNYVETEDVDLFKKVKIKPAMGKVKIGKILVIKKLGN